MKRLKMMSMVLVAAIGFSGCSTVLGGSQAVANQEIKGIVVGQTNKEDVKTAYGEPLSIDLIDGNEIWLYRHLESKADMLTHIPVINVVGGYNTITKYLQIDFNGSGVVKSYSLTRQTVRGKVGPINVKD
ncbi:MAG: hypothetical protein M1486_05770 [Gammaproteobacteria bacterium]|nr:hypothetical protein [Gammaproteobacteria bacterium]